MRHWFKASILLVVAALTACGDDDNAPFGPGGGVGAPCRDDFDCAARCDEGFCTFNCENDSQCTPGSACVDEHGGICAVLCNSDPQCGPGFRCRSTDRRRVGGSVLVCRG